MKPFQVRRFMVLITVSILGLGSVRAQQQDLPQEVIAYADLVLYNGKVLTADDDFTIVEAVAVRDGKFLAVSRLAQQSEGRKQDLDTLPARGAGFGGSVEPILHPRTARDGNRRFLRVRKRLQHSRVAVPCPPGSPLPPGDRTLKGRGIQLMPQRCLCEAS